MDDIDEETQARLELGRGLARELGRSRAHTTLAETREGRFRFELSAHRSLGRGGFKILMAAVIAVNLVVGGVFLSLGAWPVTAFCGLDVLLVYAAFKINYRAGRARETIDLSPSALRVTRVYPSGASETLDLDPYWARVRLDERADGQTALALVSHGRSFGVASFLSDDERRDFAESLTAALLTARTVRPQA
jgi:uncharacterized membrane protein